METIINSTIQKRRNPKKTTTNIIMLLVSGVIFALGITIFNSPETSAIYYLFMTLGIVGGFVSVIMILVGSTSLYYTPTNSVIKESTLLFDIEQIDQLIDKVSASDFTNMPMRTKNQHSGLKLEVCVSRDGQFAQCTILKYIPYNYEPVGAPYVVPQGLISRLVAALGEK